MDSTENELLSLNLSITLIQLGSIREADIDAFIVENNLNIQERIALVDCWRRHPRNRNCK